MPQAPNVPLRMWYVSNLASVEAAMRVLILGVVLSPAAAMACAGLACSFVPAVTDGASMPANVPAVMFATASGPDTDFDPTDAGFELRRANGDEVASTIEANGSTVLIRPTQPLAANESFVVRYSRGCGRGEIEEARFSTSAAQPMPTSIGTLTVKAKGHGEIAVPQGSQCVEIPFHRRRVQRCHSEVDSRVDIRGYRRG